MVIFGTPHRCRSTPEGESTHYHFTSYPIITSYLSLRLVTWIYRMSLQDQVKWLFMLQMMYSNWTTC